MAKPKRRITTPEPKKEYYETFEELYEEFWEPIQKQYFYIEKDWHLAEDLAQEAMLRIYQYWDRIQWENLSGAIATIVNNTRYGYVRKIFDKVDRVLYDNILDFEHHDDGITDPIKVLVSKEAMDFSKEALYFFKESEIELFNDVYLKSMTTKEVAKKHKTTAGNIYIRLFRIRNVITEHLGNNGYTSSDDLRG